MGSRGAVLAGLSTPSYRDIIQTAAIAAAVQSPDSALIDGLEKILGEQRLAALALAQLASQGDTRALTDLVRHRNDTETLGAPLGAGGDRAAAGEELGKGA